ncbi:MAG: hypothetical protein WCG05_03770, partial [Alphaproteobacteria bacterium]
SQNNPQRRSFPSENSQTLLIFEICQVLRGKDLKLDICIMKMIVWFARKSKMLLNGCIFGDDNYSENTEKSKLQT